MSSKKAAAAAADDAGYVSPLYVTVPSGAWPVVYHPTYNISFAGLEKLHPFDSSKWGKIVQFLTSEGLLRPDQLVQPVEAQRADLLKVHTPDYLNSLKWSSNVARVTEVFLVAMLPNALVQHKVLKPFRLHTGGTVLAAKLAMDRGWAINIGGGFHHCCGYRGGGFCAYADITMAIKFLQNGFAGQQQGKIERAMIVDLDAHQGNGHERDFLGDSSVFILDAYNVQIYPNDWEAKLAISCSVELMSGIGDDAYLAKVSEALEKSMEKFSAQLVVYNAGTDIMAGDPLGHMNISPNGIMKRDEMVFQACRSRGIPIVMVTSGGYQRTNARAIADSVLNLRAKGLIEGPSGA